MTDSPTSAPEGWYDDPHAPGRMRYFDGQAWTNHFHNPGELPEVGGWINTTFSVFAQHWPGAVTLALVASLVGNFVTWFGFREVFAGVALRDEELVNLDGGTAVGLAALTVFGIVWQGLGWIALNRYMQRAHYQANPTVGEAVTHAVRRLPKYLAIGVALTLAFAGLVGIVIGLLVAVPALGIFAMLLMLIGLVWVFVKLTFLTAAIAAAPPGTAVLRASAGISTGHFWGIAGRVIAFTMALGFATNIITALLGDFGSAIDAQALVDSFQASGDTFSVDNFQFSTLFPSTGTFVIALVITSVIGAATTMITTSAFMRLYLDVGGPSEI